MDTNDTSPPPLDTPTITILRRDYQAAAAPNASPDFVKKYPTNRAMIDAVNNSFWKLTIHILAMPASLVLVTLKDWLSTSIQPKNQLQTDEDLHAIQVTDIPFFIKKNNVTALFKKYGNIQSCCLHTHTNAKVQQARIVYDDASSIQHFIDKQWAIYCYSTCLHIMPCSVTLDRKKSRREFVAVLSQLPPNTIDVHLAPLVREIGAMAINISLSLNSYKPKGWAYITFKSQQMMDTAMEQSIALQGRRLQWEL
ncbi:hypothetical protein GLOIN_2v1762049 [Rhizophagus irregularis DAOM 181602=DAOM 197198]|nr:hypothetical protein GLOIN_2v1762049 [Rhizophagus irregularis DAOM 181602=DAOM 197198]